VKILVTGFEPFGGSDVNPSWEAARSLDGRVIAGAEVVGVQLPVSWEQAGPALENAVRQHTPDAVICLGQSGRAELSPERIGINVCNGKDNDELERTEVPIVEGGPDAYFSTLPFVELAAAIREAGIPARVSNTAGTYLCNFAAYTVRHCCATNGLDIPAGFIHIPSRPDQVVEASERQPRPSMSQELINRGIEVAVETVAERIAGDD